MKHNGKLCRNLVEKIVILLVLILDKNGNKYMCNLVI